MRYLAPAIARSGILDQSEKDETPDPDEALPPLTKPWPRMAPESTATDERPGEIAPPDKDTTAPGERS